MSYQLLHHSNKWVPNSESTSETFIRRLNGLPFERICTDYAYTYDILSNDLILLSSFFSNITTRVLCWSIVFLKLDLLA